MDQKYSTILIVIAIFLILVIIFLIPKQFSPIYDFVSTNIGDFLILKVPQTSEKSSNSKSINKENMDYTISRPNWTIGEVPKITGENIIDTIAYTENCTFIIVNTAISMSDDDIDKYLNDIVNNKISSYFISIDKKVINKEHIYIEGGFKTVGKELYAVGKGFFSDDKKKLYFMIFTGKPNKFEEFCRPHIEGTFDSFKLQK